MEKNYHLTYCTNIHPAETWSEVFNALKKNVPEVKAKVSPDQPFGVGLRLSNIASSELLLRQNLEEFKCWLGEQNLYVFTMNGFPYGNFNSDATVKDAVHLPDWTTTERFNYTQRLFKILEELLPKGLDGGVSTSPVSYKPWFANDPEKKEEVCRQSAKYLAKIAMELFVTRDGTGKLMHLDIEPEPDGFIENSTEIVEFFNKYLIPEGRQLLTDSLGISPLAAENAIKEHIRVCYDVCHFALAYEEPEYVFETLKKSGIQIGKIQISAALKVDLPQDHQERKTIEKELSAFDESTYLHQVVERRKDNSLKHYNDLPDALLRIHDMEAIEWRTHFHVPIFINQFNNLQSTNSDIVNMFAVLNASEITPHLEVETYTWDILPDELQIDLVPSIQRELEWVIELFREQSEEFSLMENISDYKNTMI